jgi:uncharacterized OB-fold protein
MKMPEQEKERLAVTSGGAEQPFEWSVGRYTSKFLAEIRDHKRIVGIRCPQCQKVMVPPRKVCGDCFVPMSEIVELSGKGTVDTFTVLAFGFVDPSTGREKQVPYTWGFIRLDGADNTMIHYIDETDPEKLRVGMRVEAVFEEERHGDLLDIRHFRTLEG